MQNSVVSLTCCRLWDKTADHKWRHYSQTGVMRQYIRSMIVQCHLPTDINAIRSCHHKCGQLTCGSLSCLLVTWSMTNLVFMWRHWNVTYPLLNFCKYSSFHMKATYLPVCLLPFNFSYTNMQFDKNPYPEMWKFPKNYHNDTIPCPMIFIFQNMSEQCWC